MNIDSIYNMDAEINVIGSILIKNDSICEIVDFLRSDDFYRTRHGLIYKVLKKMYENNVPMDIISVSERLKNNLSDVGGMTYLCDIVNSVVNANNIREYGEIVKEKSNIRELFVVFNNSLDNINNGGLSSEEIVSLAQEGILHIRDYAARDDGDMERIMMGFMDILQNRYEKGGDVQGIKSGYKVIDKMLGGLSREDLIILAARPSMGKTAMALNIILNTVFKEKSKTAFFNLEMGISQIIDRAISQYTKIPMNNIKNASLSDEQWSEVGKAASQLAESNMKIYDKIFTLSGIKDECRRLKLKGILDIVVIDYLQLIDSGEKRENRNQDISKITRSLKLMAKELEVTVIILSQLSRAPEARSDHRPMLSDLRESGSIEQDADTVLFLYRDEYYHKDSESKGIIECIVAKNRNGEVGTVRLRWKPELQRVENMGSNVMGSDSITFIEN